jgi:hypothetical protein
MIVVPTQLSTPLAKKVTRMKELALHLSPVELARVLFNQLAQSTFLFLSAEALFIIPV